MFPSNVLELTKRSIMDDGDHNVIQMHDEDDDGKMERALAASARRAEKAPSIPTLNLEDSSPTKNYHSVSPDLISVPSSSRFTPYQPRQPSSLQVQVPVNADTESKSSPSSPFFDAVSSTDHENILASKSK